MFITCPDSCQKGFVTVESYVRLFMNVRERLEIVFMFSILSFTHQT